MEQEGQVAASSSKRRRLLLGVAVLFLLAGLGYTAYWWFIGQFRETTDDAYVAGNVIDITPLIAGTVVAINADNTDFAKQGQILVKLDDTDAAVALEQAKADLAESVREVSRLFEMAGQLRANVAVRESELQQAQNDLRRLESLVSKKFVSQEDVQHARTRLAGAEASLQLAEHELAGARALVANTTLEHHPQVERTKAKVRDAYVALQRTIIAAPVSGYVAKRSVQLGQRVNPGTSLLAVVSLNRLWVEANFKENQLVDMRINQPVTMTSDLYGNGVVYCGKVLGIGAGTGSVFSLLPPQNATGNWIKIVQRVPVRISLEAREISRLPLRIGLSVRVAVDTHDTRGHVLAQSASTEPVYSTPVYNAEAVGVEPLIEKIIADNMPAGQATALRTEDMP